MSEEPKLGSSFNRDVLWNLASTAVLGIAGLALNLGIGRFYGPEVFGVFTQVFAIYVIMSQLAVGGFMFSVLSFTGQHADEPKEARSIIGAALVLTSLLAAILCAAVLLARDEIGRLLGSPQVSEGLFWVVPGLWCFALNKVLIFSLNGLGHMRSFALAQALRYFAILLALVSMILYDAPAAVLPGVFSVAELALLPLLLAYFLRFRLITFGSSITPWMRKHISFGARTFTSGLLLDVNQKVDVLMLGYFSTDLVVGIYGFASMLAEGLYQVVIVVQSNVSPLLSRLKSEGRLSDARPLLRKISVVLCPAMALVSAAITLAYPTAAVILTGNAAFADGWIFFAILMTGMTLSAGYGAFGFILNQWGHPGHFSGFLAMMVATNLVLNASLIPIWGGVGAAVATATTFVVAIVYLKLLVRRVVGVRI